MIKIKYIVQIFLAISILIAIFIAWNEIQKPERFPIEKVKISAPFTHVSQLELQNVVSPFIQTGFFALKVSELQQQLLQLPWIKQVNLSRQWPNTVSITIKEQQAFVRWRYDGVINTDDIVFHPSLDSIPTALPQLHGPVGFETKLLQNYRKMSKILDEINVSIVKLSLSDRLAWSLRLNNNIELLLGREEPTKRLTRFVTMYHIIESQDGKHAEKVDLRYPHGFAVRWVQNKNTTLKTDRN